MEQAVVQKSPDTRSPTAQAAPLADPLESSELHDPLIARPQGAVQMDPDPSAPKPSRIESIDSMGTEDVLTQDASFGSLEGMIAVAQAGQDELAGYIQDAARAAGAEAAIPPIKSLERAAAKVKSDFDGDWTKVTDIIRGSVVSKSVDALGTAYDALTSNVTVKRVKNRFKKPKEEGYRDMNLVVEVPKAKMLGEVQLHVAQIQELKSGAEHKTYERIQAIERAAKDENRALTPEETAEVKKLKAQSKEAYDAAWAAAKGGGEPASAPSEAAPPV